MNEASILLALETTGRSGSVAILRTTHAGIVCETEVLEADVGSAKTLAPAIDRLLSRLAIDVTKLSAIALLTGPGSFTGLRVGVATAKAMAYALKIPAIEIDTLDAIASQIAPDHPPDHPAVHPAVHSAVHVVLDAYRGQVFYAGYRISQSQLVKNSPQPYEKISPTQIVNIEYLLVEMLGAGSEDSFDLCGPGCDRIRKFIADPENVGSEQRAEVIRKIRWIDGPETSPMAETVAKLGFEKFLAGDISDAFHILPQYYRSSAAEELAGKSKLG
jgi:tRNA threonylcarbamoyladenosine biosynthesis protein TsaB